MTFSDEDLKQFRACIPTIQKEWARRISSTPLKLEPLLARLEAAEAVTSDMNQLIELGGIEVDSLKYVVCKRDLEIWRKAAGK